MNSVRKPLYLFLLIIFICFSFPSANIFAQSPTIQMKVDVGYEGKVKSNRGFPINVTLENNGNDFSGEMLIPFAAGYNLKGTKAMKVELPKGTSKTFEVTMPAANTNYSSNVNSEIITLYEGSVKKGGKIKTNGKNQLTYRTVDEEVTIGLVNEKEARLKELQLVKLNGKKPDITSLTKNNLPADEIGLQFFDYLVIDDYAISELSNEQQNAIIKWIEQGGVLIAGASTKGNHAWGKMETYMPIEGTDIIDISDLTFLTSSSKKPLDFTSLSVISGKLRKGAESALQIGSLPIIANNELGDGEVWQVAFSLGEEPLSSWEGYSEYLSSLFKMPKGKIQQTNYYESDYERAYHHLGSTNELFPASNFSITILITMMLVYLLIIIPILYFILRKTDKREHAWWVIPAISIFVSIGIFAIGAKDRIGKPQLAEIGMFKVNNNGSISGMYAASLFTNKNGDYELEVPNQQFYGVPVTNQDNVFEDQSINQTIVAMKRNETVYHFPNVDYWSARSVIGFASREKVNQFNIDLKLENGHLKGKITNEMPFDFEELFVWSGQEQYHLGELKSGETIEVDELLKKGLLSTPTETRNLFTYDENDLIEMKKSNLAHSLLNEYSLAGENSPVVFGYTNSSIINTNVKNKNPKHDRLSLIYQSFNPSGELKGEFTLTNEQLGIKVNVVSGMIYDNLNMYNEMGLEDGVYEVVISLPKQINHSKATYDYIQYHTSNYTGFTLSFLDHKTGEYVIVDEGNHSVLKDDPSRFISDGKIMVMLEKHDPQAGTYVIFPQFTVKGAVIE